MADKIDGKECRYWFRLTPGDYRRCALRGKNDNCDEIEDCFIKELLGKLAQKEQDYEKVKQTLDIIKEIAENREIFCENCSSGVESFTCDDCGYVKILQKIREWEQQIKVEGEHSEG